ncbi:MAG: hypothetical protein JWP81_1092 [Ferruginibacter sp.]|nr:hypothetical protein [Ferruginibacter sp.]
MQISQELINRFFLNECSSDEVDLVTKYFSANKDAFEKYMGKAEWDIIDTGEDLDTEQSKILLVSLRQQLFNKRKVGLFAMNHIPFKAILAAASVILLIASAWWFTAKSNIGKNGVPTGDQAVLVRHNEPGLNWLVVRNTGKNARVLKLGDGSVVTLFKNSILRYPDPFASNIRAIELNGDAFFQVAKNKLKPFIVYAGNLSTTALGTSFRITAFDEGKLGITIKLLTGKVVVKSVDAAAKWKKDRFMLPGDLLTYNTPTAAVLVTRSAPKNETIANISRKLQRDIAGSELRFNSTPLNEVINSIATLHHIKINYSDADLQGMNFTGIIKEYDDVQTILKMIAQMNELQVNQLPEGFTLSSLQKK